MDNVSQEAREAAADWSASVGDPDWETCPQCLRLIADKNAIKA